MAVKYVPKIANNSLFIRLLYLVYVMKRKEFTFRSPIVVSDLKQVGK